MRIVVHALVDRNEPAADPLPQELTLRSFVFPDGQPHVALEAAEVESLVARGADFDVVVSIVCAADLVQLALVLEALGSVVSAEYFREHVSVNIAYLLGARMDRRIAPGQPATLFVFAQWLNVITENCAALRVLDPHSEVTMRELPRATVLHPDRLVARTLAAIEDEFNAKPVVVIPDKGAVPRTTGILTSLGAANAVAYCEKKRDPQTGKLSGFALVDGDVKDKPVLIVDDICDGGGTFSGVAEVLREHGASHVFLCVTHGIFSKGPVISGIDRVFSTDSYGWKDTTGVLGDELGKHHLHRYRTHEGRVVLEIVENFVQTLLLDLRRKKQHPLP